jgi:hypothetical protein
MTLESAITGAPRSKAVLVLGMHRSGTSALAGVLVRLGLEAPRTLMPPNEANPLGFWESDAIVRFHDRLLRQLGTSWDAWTRVPDPPAACDAELSRLIESEFGGASQFMVKDPRMCRLVPLWRRVLAAAHIEPAVVLVTRGVADVCRSLAVRDGLPEAFSSLMWLRHVLDAERGTRGWRRTFVAYDELLVDWRTQSARIETELDVSWACSEREAGADIDGFLRSELRHHHGTSEPLAVPEPIRHWLTQVEGAIRSLAQSDSDPGALSTLEHAHQELERLADTVGSDDELLRHRLDRRAEALTTTVASLELQMARLAADRERLIAATSVLEADRDAWREQAHRLGEACAALRTAAQVAADERQTLEDRLRDLEQRATRVGELHETVNGLQAQVDALHSSWSWRITSPLRRVADVLGLNVPSRVR